MVRPRGFDGLVIRIAFMDCFLFNPSLYAFSKAGNVISKSL